MKAKTSGRDADASAESRRQDGSTSEREAGGAGTETQASPPRRMRSRQLLTLLCAALLVWLAWGAVYSLWRQPANVFEEIYWADVDANSIRALEASGYFPVESLFILPSAAYPFKTTTLDGLGEACYTYCPRMPWSVTSFLDSDEFIGNVGFYTYYTKIEIMLGVDIEGFGGYEAESSPIHRFTLSSNPGLLEIDLPRLFADSSPGNEEYEVDCCLDYDLKTQQLDATIYHTTLISNEEATRVAAQLLQALLAAYFDNAGDASRFSPNDLGDWSWGEVEHRHLAKDENGLYSWIHNE